MAYRLEHIRILVADDMPPIITLMKEILTTFGFKQIFTAHSGEKAYDLVLQHDPDLIITDWIMGYDMMDGLELTKKIRRDPKIPNPYVPIIMMTGFSSRLRVEMARDSGITEFMTKPFSARDLYARVFQIIERPRQFVEAGEFLGPDRRRRSDEEYNGANRRGGRVNEGKSSWDIEITPNK